jgi:hypothetical protein
MDVLAFRVCPEFYAFRNSSNLSFCCISRGKKGDSVGILAEPSRDIANYSHCVIIARRSCHIIILLSN